MLDTHRLYFEATVAVAIMAMFAIISGFASVAFVLTGIALTVRLSRMTTTPIPPEPST